MTAQEVMPASKAFLFVFRLSAWDMYQLYMQFLMWHDVARVVGFRISIGTPMQQGEFEDITLGRLEHEGVQFTFLLFQVPIASPSNEPVKTSSILHDGPCRNAQTCQGPRARRSMWSCICALKSCMWSWKLDTLESIEEV